MEILILLSLIFLNGIFALAEIAIVSSRKTKLLRLSKEGNKNAQIALDLANSPTRFLSTVQIGITFIGIFAGAFSGETIARQLADSLKSVAILAPYSDILALFLVVSAVTYLSLVIGELVPKRIGLSNPEAIALHVVKPMSVISFLFSPLVLFLTNSTELIFKALNIKNDYESQINEDEVKMLIKEGARTGVFNIAERDIVERAFKLSDRRVNTLMTSRTEIIWLDINSPQSTIKKTISTHPHSHFPICKAGLDTIVGTVRTEDILRTFLIHNSIDLNKTLQKPNFIPENMEGFKVLELFKKTGIHVAIVVDEYGNTLGLITLADILDEIVGDIPTINELTENDIVKREDGSYLVDGLVSVDEFKDYFKIRKLEGEKTAGFHTLGGFVTSRLGQIPTIGDTFEYDRFQFEIMDMDGNRVDKILVSDIEAKKHLS